MDKLSYLSNADSSYIDSLYQLYKEDPSSVDSSWKKFFEVFEFGQSSLNGTESSFNDLPIDAKHAIKEINVLNMIH